MCRLPAVRDVNGGPVDLQPLLKDGRGLIGVPFVFFFFFYLCCPRTVPCIAFMCVECARGDSDKVSLPVPSFVLRSCVASLLQPKHAWRSDREQLSIVSSRLQTAAQDHLKTFRQASVRRFAPRFQLLARCESCNCLSRLARTGTLFRPMFSLTSPS